ncbi:hypothetical protein BHE74_00020629, partial [Ensete ventricosum]
MIISFIPSKLVGSKQVLYDGAKELAENEPNSLKYVVRSDNKEDVLHARVRTTGVVEIQF